MFKRFTKPQRRQPLRGSSSAGALTSHSGHSILLFRAFKLAICPAWHLPPGPKPFKPFRRPFEGNSRSYTPRPSVFKGVQACRLPGPKPFKPFRRPFQGLSRATQATAFCFSERLSLPFARPDTFPRAPNPSNPSAGLSKATLAATRHGHLFLRAFKLAVCRAPNPSNPSAGLSKATLAATHHGHLFLRAFKPAVCRAPNPSNPPAGLSKATLAATRHGHLFLRAFKPAICRAPNPSNPPASLSKATLAATRHGHLFLRAFKPAVCRAFKPSRRPFEGNSRSYTPRQSVILKAFKPAACRAPNPSNPPAGLSKATLAATRHGNLLFWRRSSLPLAGPQTLQTLPQAFRRLWIFKVGVNLDAWNGVRLEGTVLRSWCGTMVRFWGHGTVQWYGSVVRFWGHGTI